MGLLDRLDSAIKPDGFQITSEIIKARLKKNKATFKGSDNIFEYIQEGDMERLIEEVAKKVEGLLSSLVIDFENDEEMNKTATTFANILINDAFRGRYIQTPPQLGVKTDNRRTLSTCGPIRFDFTCSEDLQPWEGQCWIGTPHSFSSINLRGFEKIVEHVSSRLHNPENLSSLLYTQFQTFLGSDVFEGSDGIMVLKTKSPDGTIFTVEHHKNDGTTYTEANLREFYRVADVKDF